MSRRGRRAGTEERLILLSAGTAARRRAVRSQATELCAAVDWRRLASLLATRRLLGTLGPYMLGLVEAGVGQELALAVEDALAAGRRQSAFLALIAERAVDALALAGVRATTLKGPALSESLYGDPGCRPSGDIDLLVDRELLTQAVAVVHELGYAAPTDHLADDGLPLLHFTLLHTRGQLPPIELHWRIHWYECDFARERLLAPADRPAGEWRPEPIDELITLLLFYARDGFISLRYAVDLAAWWDAFGESLQPGALDSALRAYPELGPVAWAALRVAEKTVGLPAAQIAPAAVKLGARGRIALRLADPYPHSSEAQLYADIGLVDGLLTPRGGFREFVKRQLALSREPTDTDSAQPGGSLMDGLRMFGRYGLAMSRLLRPSPLG
jgi:hypothetical protein